MTWPQYVRGTTGETNSEIARRIGLSQPSVSRWFSGSIPDPKTAAAFARAYGRPVLEAFLAAGFLAPEEADERPSAVPSLDDLPDHDLLKEVGKRMAEGRGGTDAGNTDQKTPGPADPGDDDPAAQAARARRDKFLRRNAHNPTVQDIEARMARAEEQNDLEELARLNDRIDLLILFEEDGELVDQFRAGQRANVTELYPQDLAADHQGGPSVYEQRVAEQDRASEDEGGS